MTKSIRRFGMDLAQHFYNAGFTRAVCRVAMMGVILLFSATAANAAFVTPQVITNSFTLTATGISPITSNLTTVTPLRTPAVITFLHLNSVTNQYTPADVYHAGQMIYVQVTDGDQNTDPLTVQTVTITLTDSVSGDIETLTLTETGPNTGKFIGGVASTKSTAATPNNGVISVTVDSILEASYTDPLDAITTVAAAALVDPFGLVFDSATGAPVDGATVTLINTATGLPATVLGDDGISAYPSTIVTGSTVTDASGAVYNFAPGKYRFPLIAAGTYHLQITPPAGYNFPSQATDVAIQALPTAATQPGGAYTLMPASRGNDFIAVPGPAVRIDIPLDAKGVNLFVQKTTSTSVATIGDRVAYQISVENVHTATPSSATIISDTLPIGFRYQTGSATLDGTSIANPTISANARGLTFNIGTIAPATVKKIAYTVVVGANAKPGVSTNVAFASGTMAAVAVQSNVSKAAVTVREDLLRSLGYIVGVVFIDENMNELQDDGERGVQGIRIFMEDGRNTVTDKDGRYHFDGVKLGTHVVQMDRATINKRYQAVALTQTRFSDNDYSQFAEVNGGGLVRANFRLVERAPEKMPVTVVHKLSVDDNTVWADVDIKRGADVRLFKLNGFYTLPKGWKYLEGTATLDGDPTEPEITPAGLVWKLNPDKAIQHIRLAIKGDGKSGLKQAVAYARFASPGTEKGRTGLAKLNIKDTLTELYDQRSFNLNVKFANRKAVLPEAELVNLEALVDSLKGLVVRELVVEGHTNNIRIAPNHRDEFANNMVLSQARADYIAQYFKEKLHLSDDIVTAIGKGATEPIYSNKTVRGRKLNRRVVLKIRADKVSHDFSFELQDKVADAYGEAQDDWNYQEDKTLAKKVEEKQKGIISPAESMSLPHAVTSVRTALDSRLKAELLLDGEVVPNDRIGFKSADSDTGLTTYTYIGVNFGKTGKHTLELKGLDSFGNARFDETVHVVRTGNIAKIKLAETAANVADGKTPVRFKLEIIDNRGVPIHGSLTLKQLGGDLLSTRQTEVSALAKEASQVIRVSKDGWVELAPVSNSGSHQIVLGYGDVQETIELYVKPEVRDWILVGFAEGTVGYNKLSGAAQPVTKAEEGDKFYKDGRIAFYAKGRVSGDFLLTMSYDTAAKTAAEKNSRFGDIDPNAMYTIYGDNTQQQFDGTSSKKLYLKIERDSFYALFGDYNTGLSTTELTRYSRTFTGVKAEMHEDNIGFSAFATQTSLTSIKDDIRGNGTSGLYKLSRKNIVTNSETIRIETVDRFKSEVIVSSIQLTRHLDYDIDYVLGTIWFKQPILSKDADLNPIIIRVEYESDDKTDQFTVAGGRVYVKPTSNIEVGGTFVSEGHLGGSNTLSGVDAKVELTDNIELRAETATSTNNGVQGQAWKVESRLTGEKLSGKAYARSQDDNFGLGQQLGSENSTLKVGADGQYRLNKDANINIEAFHQKVVNTGATRNMASAQYNQRLDETLGVRAGVRVNRDKDGSGAKTGSTLASVGATKELTSRLSIRADHEEALASENGVDFPSRTGIGADYHVTDTTTLSATQEWTRGNKQDTNSTRIGIRTQPWNGAQMSTSYEQQLSENGKRSFANAGLLQTWKIYEALTFSASIDRTKVLSSAAPVPLNINAPVATGGESFTAYSIGANYAPGEWVWTNRLEYRTSNLSNHRGAEVGVQGHIHENLASQFTLRWQKDVLASNALTLISDASLRAAWRPSYDRLILLDRFDIRRNVQTGAGTDSRSLRYINNLTANWQAYDAWRLRFNHGIKLTDESIGTSSWTGLTDLVGMQLIYDFNESWDLTMQAAALRVRHLHNYQPNAGLALGFNMFDNFWVSLGYNFTGFYDQDFTAAEYARKGVYMRFRFKFDQNSLEDMLK
jgi:uncharacterized repeat protein (TIGR01451 family)